MRSIPVTALACFGAFWLVMVIAVAIRHLTGWDDPKGLMNIIAVFAAMVTYNEARS